MNILVYSARRFERPFLDAANTPGHNIDYIETRLTIHTADLASGHEAVFIFVNDDASAAVLERLHERGVRYLLLRSAGFNNVDIPKAAKLGIRVARVPAYSPYAVAEHAITLMLALNRKLIRANNRIHDLNFSLDGLTGFDMHGKTVGVIGTGSIGSVIVRILHGFGCDVIAYDTVENRDLISQYGLKYTDLQTLYKSSDIITLHVPLLPATKYLVDKAAIAQMKKGVMLINTSRGLLIKTKDVIDALKSQHIGYLGIDVYEEEAGLFFEDHSEDVVQDDLIARLLTFRNVIVTSHQGFLTDTALRNISETTLANLSCLLSGSKCDNEVV
jgi:D-lactate dehydrogenase